jgi:saccharopine dehydrogenase (NAD+, L-glutamate forming)
VVIACAGPFFEVGAPVVRSCIQQGTHYVDITAETDFIRKIIDEFGAQAKNGNVIVVPGCGINSVADMGVFYAQQLTHSPIVRALNVVSMKAAMSGGSLKTLLSVANDDNRWRIIRDSYALNERLDSVCGPGSDPTDYETDMFAVKYDNDKGKWTGPSPTAPVNTRIVRRTASLSRIHPERHLQLHHKFEFRELSESESFFSAMIPTTLAMLQSPVKWALSFSLVNRVMEMLMPHTQDDSGPDEVARKQNWFRFRIDAKTESNEQIRVDVHGGDFYDVSAETAVQAAICILEDKEAIVQELQGGGIFTPAFALGERYLRRLKTSTLLKFEKKPLESEAVAAA